jgi:hypothetical protein
MSTNQPNGPREKGSSGAGRGAPRDVYAGQVTDDGLNDVIETLRQISCDEHAPMHLRLGAANSLTQIVQRRQGVLPDDPEPGALLTPSEREALRDALPWAWDLQLLDDEQQAVLIKLGLYSRKELDKEIAAVQPRRTKHRGGF